MHIVLVDDNPEFLAVTARILTLCGHAVQTATSGAEALRLLRAESIDLLITDIVMPREDGLELMMKVRQQFPTVAMIGMTGSTTQPALYLKFARGLGAVSTLLKPFSRDELLIALARVELARTTPPRPPQT